MSVEPPSGDTILTALAGAMSGGIVTKLVDAFTGKKNREVKALGDAIDSLSEQLKAADDRMDKFGERLDDCHALHDSCEQGRKQDRLEIDDLKAKIARMMSGAAATVYHLNAPKSDPGKGRGK